MFVSTQRKSEWSHKKQITVVSQSWRKYGEETGQIGTRWAGNLSLFLYPSYPALFPSLSPSSLLPPPSSPSLQH